MTKRKQTRTLGTTISSSELKPVADGEEKQVEPEESGETTGAGSSQCQEGNEKRGDSIGSLRKHAVEMAYPKDDKLSAAYKTS